MTTNRVLLALLGIVVANVLAVFGATPAMASPPPQVTLNMPFTGKWAWNVAASAPWNDNINDSHPAAHERYAADWATDLYAAPGQTLEFR